MRGNPIVELIAILVMLASILVGGGYWLINKQAQHQIKEIRQELKNINMDESFESKHKVTTE